MLQDIQGFKSQRSLRIHPSIRHHTFGLKISLTVKYTNNIDKKKERQLLEPVQTQINCYLNVTEKKNKNKEYSSFMFLHFDKKCEFNPKLSDIEFRQHFEQKRPGNTINWIFQVCHSTCASQYLYLDV